MTESWKLPPSALTALTQAAAAIGSTLELDSVLGTISRLAANVTRADASSVFFLAKKGGKLETLAATGPWREAMIGRSFDADLGLPGHVLRTGEPILLLDAHAHAKFSREIDQAGSTRTRTVMAVPMLHRGEVIGVIEAINRRDGSDFSDRDLKILKVFASLAVSAIQNAQVHEELKQRFAGFRDSVLKRTNLIGESSNWRRVLELCDRVARSSASVLLLGETGTGKEVIARHIHNRSRRSDESFVAVNCAALPENLLESELFGHEKGSFTGAYKRRRGWFEVAGRGTLLLDEIGEISRAMQAKLLRVLQDKEIVRVGGTETIHCDTRIIAATNRNLKNMMIDGLFREDLYYRLCVFPIELPPLRQRRSDIPLFVEYFASVAARECNIRDLTVAEETVRMLSLYDWPGNIRELQNVIERAVLMSDGATLLPAHLPPEIGADQSAGDGAMDAGTLYGQERALILDALAKRDWNQSQAAKDLGISRYHLRHRIKKYDLRNPRHEESPDG